MLWTAIMIAVMCACWCPSPQACWRAPVAEVALAVKQAAEGVQPNYIYNCTRKRV